jgi:hypothetical protein
VVVTTDLRILKRCFYGKFQTYTKVERIAEWICTYYSPLSSSNYQYVARVLPFFFFSGVF